MKVELLKPHTHRGNENQVGEVIDLPSRAAEFAIKAGSAKKAPRRKKETESDSETQGTGEMDPSIRA